MELTGSFGQLFIIIMQLFLAHAEFVEKMSHKVTVSGQTLIGEDNHVTLSQSDYITDEAILRRWKRENVMEVNNIDAVHGFKNRIKRQLGIKSGLTEEQKLDSVVIHNILRRLENSSDMEFLIWNDYLAVMAQEWLEDCIWGHGQPERDSSTMPFNPLGQNLYFNTGFLNVTHATIRFYDEIEWYDYDTGQCSGRMCGHYTQVTWAKSREMGCGFHKCDVLTDVNDPTQSWKGAYYFGCNYGPAGNFVNQKPFKKGAECTECSSGKFWCDTENPRGLCRRDCDTVTENCTCSAVCQNGGIVQCDCSCQCQPGFTDIDCSEICEDKHKNCGGGWPKSYCTHVKYGAQIKQYCPELCEVCTNTGSPIEGTDCITTLPTTFTQTASTAHSTTQSTTSTTQSTASTTQSTASTTPTTASTTQSTASTTPTTASTTQSTASTTQSTASTTQSTASTTQSTASTTASTTQSTASTTQSTASTTQSTASTTQSTASTTQSTASTTQSTASTTQSTASTTASTTQSTASTTQSTASTTQSTASTTQSTASTTQSTALTTQSTASTTKSTASTTQSTASTTQSTASTTQSTASTTQSTASTTLSTGSTATSTSSTIQPTLSPPATSTISQTSSTAQTSTNTNPTPISSPSTSATTLLTTATKTPPTTVQTPVTVNWTWPVVNTAVTDPPPRTASLWSIALGVIAMDVLLLGIVALLVVFIRRRLHQRRLKRAQEHEEALTSHHPSYSNHGSLRAYKPAILTSVEEQPEMTESHYQDVGPDAVSLHVHDEPMPDLPPPPKSILKGSYAQDSDAESVSSHTKGNISDANKQSNDEKQISPDKLLDKADKPKQDKTNDEVFDY